jgi:hypothetical protein
MIGTLHDGEALNAHERLQPVELLPHSLGEASQPRPMTAPKRGTPSPSSSSSPQAAITSRNASSGNDTSVRAAALALERVRILAALKGG